ncbi:MAG: hypothetical protein RIS47_1563 [Bacteroidota bacterium]|jgi:ribosome-associated protein
MTKINTSSSEELVGMVVESIQEKKGKNITSLNISALDNSFCDYFVICEASSTTQVEAIANFVEFNLKEKLQEYPLHVEGKRNAQWVLVDYGNVVVHIFLDAVRDFYKLESLWGDGKVAHIPNLD